MRTALSDYCALAGSTLSKYSAFAAFSWARLLMKHINFCIVMISSCTSGQVFTVYFDVRLLFHMSFVNRAAITSQRFKWALLQDVCLMAVAEVGG